MARPTIDEARISTRYRKKTLDAEQAAKVRQAIRESKDEEEEPGRHEKTKPGDPRQLRGIPVQTRGVGGATPGSLPHSVE